ncbi:MAG: response regulator transcription factor [Sphingobacteriaceae bacterium]|jgi:DNA-binding response OmpR family regulator|nr:response regulator transcription factor [Sphingobacteriaceae bacterium]
MANKILIADDDPAILDVVTIILEDAGYEVNSTEKGEELLDMKENLPDLILLDIWMLGKDGRDVCRNIKNNPATQNIPVLLVSANRDIKKIAKECLADSYLAKPFEMDDLLAIIKKYLN